MIKILHSSDLNFGAQLPFSASVCKRLYVAQFAVLDRILGYAVEQQVHLLVFTGNLFARHDPDNDLKEAVAQRLASLPEDVRVLVLPGCHDYPLGQDSVYRQESFQPWLVEPRRDPGPVCLEGVAPIYFYTLPWQCGPEQAGHYMSRHSGEGWHIGAFHSVKLTQRNPFQDPLIHWKKAIRCWELDYVLVGHHSRGSIDHDGVFLADCPGSPQGFSFHECGERYCSVVTLSEQGSTVDILPTDVIRFQKQELPMPQHDAADFLHRQLDQWAQGNLALKVRLTGAVEELFDSERELSHYRDRYALLSCEDMTRFLDSESMTQLAEEETVRGILCRRLIELAVAGGEGQRAVYEGALRELLHRFHALEEDEA